MSIRRHPRGVYQSSLLSALPWLEHGFGTAATDPAASILTLRQIHSARAFSVCDWKPELEGDALVAAEPRVWVGVKTADCVPVLLADCEHRVVAAVHCGWRGTVADTIGSVLVLLRIRYGTQPERVVAALGPAIGPCCYEVGPEVAVRFAPLFPERQDLNARAQIDLWEANRRRLRAAGIPADSIDGDAPCSACHSAEFHSFRRDRDGAGRMISAIVLK